MKKLTGWDPVRLHLRREGNGNCRKILEFLRTNSEIDTYLCQKLLGLAHEDTARRYLLALHANGLIRVSSYTHSGRHPRKWFDSQVSLPDVRPPRKMTGAERQAQYKERQRARKASQGGIELTRAWSVCYNGGCSTP